MAFSQEVPPVPAGIGEIRIMLRDKDGNPAGRAASFGLEILDAEGAVIRRREGDLTPHLTGQQASQLAAFLTAMRTKANAEILP